MDERGERVGCICVLYSMCICSVERSLYTKSVIEEDEVA